MGVSNVFKLFELDDVTTPFNTTRINSGYDKVNRILTEKFQSHKDIYLAILRSARM